MPSAAPSPVPAAVPEEEIEESEKDLNHSASNIRMQAYRVSISGHAQVAPENNGSENNTDKGREKNYSVSENNFHSIPIRQMKSERLCRILVVDDSVLNVKIMIRHIMYVHRQHPNLFLEPNVMIKYAQQNDEDPTVTVAMDLVEADDGTSALSRLQEASEDGRPFDVVFMDNIMNRMNGPEAAQAMRATGYDGLIIGVTGNVMAKDVNHYLSCGADHILFKPVNLEELTRILHRLRAT